jgi:hypothetical protein
MRRIGISRSGPDVAFNLPYGETMGEGIGITTVNVTGRICGVAVGDGLASGPVHVWRVVRREMASYLHGVLPSPVSKQRL